MNHYMLDLETMGRDTSAAMVAIGIVEFDKRDIGRKFYCNVSLEDSVNHHGRTMDPSTVMWWVRQSEKARSALMEGARPLEEALKLVQKFLYEGASRKGVVIWGNGSDFDNAILSSSYRALDVDAPWEFYNNRCFRTMKNTFKLSDLDMPPRMGEHHNALDDALFQAVHLQKILQVNELNLG